MSGQMFSVSLASDSRANLRRLEREMPRTMRAAFGAAATRAQRRLRKVMKRGGGVYGVEHFAPHSEVSVALRPGQQMGGVLADTKSIVKYRIKDGQYIGWPDALESWAERFQESATRPTTGKERRYVAIRGGVRKFDTYDRPERDVISSFAKDLARNWSAMVADRFDYYYRRNLARYGAGNVR